MNKNKKGEEIFEDIFLEENFDALMKEMEADMEYGNFKIPDEWDRQFRITIEEGLREQKMRERKLRVKRITKVTGMVAAVVVLVCTSNLTVEEAQGKGILKFFQSIFDFGKDKHITYGTDENMSMDFADETNNDVFFDGKSIEEICNQIRAELKMPMFYFKDVFNEYEITEAKYSQNFHMVNIEIKTLEGTIYITQELLLDDTSSGTVLNEGESIKVNNDNLEQEILIYKNKSNDGYLFRVEEEQTIFSVIGEIPLNECKSLAKSIYYE